MSVIEAGVMPGRRDVRTGARLRRQWRRVDRLLTAGVGSAAVAAAILLGVTAPTSSPVQPAAPVAAAVLTQDTEPQGPDGGGGGGRRSFGDRRNGGGNGRDDRGFDGAGR